MAECIINNGPFKFPPGCTPRDEAPVVLDPDTLPATDANATFYNQMGQTGGSNWLSVLMIVISVILTLGLMFFLFSTLRG